MLTQESNFLAGIYAGVRRSGLLATRPGRWLFSHSYSAYKRYLEDPFYGLAHKHPEFFRAGHVIDIGANIGYTSSLFAKAVDPGYRVYAFEPEEENFSYLQECSTHAENGGRIVPVRAAVGASDEKISLWRNERDHADHRIVSGHLLASTAASECVSVPMTSIDTFVRNNGPIYPVSFIKIDVQGYELPVCQGMEQTLRQNPGVVAAVEYCPEALSQLGFIPKDLVAWWKQRGYQAATLARDGAITDGIAADLSAGYIDLLFAKTAHWSSER